MLKNYELLYILHPDLEGSSDKISEKVAGFIKKSGGEITNQEDWGKRKLAYPIAKNDFGVYVLVNFKLPSENLPEVERDLRLSEEIIRFLVVTLPETTTKPKKAASKKEAKEAKAETAPKVEKENKEETAAEVKEEEKPVKKTTKKTETAEKPAKKTKKEEADNSKKAEKERMKKLDEKLEEILGE